MAQMSEPELHFATGSVTLRFRERDADAARGLEHHRAECRDPDGALKPSQRDLLGHSSVITTSLYLHGTGSAITSVAVV
jgi:hypothetical protein